MLVVKLCLLGGSTSVVQTLLFNLYLQTLHSFINLIIHCYLFIYPVNGGLISGGCLLIKEPGIIWRGPLDMLEAV